MEQKKTLAASLENKRLLFAELGMIAALLALLGAFQYSTAQAKVVILESGFIPVDVEEMIPITQEEPPLPQNAPVLPVLTEEIEIVDNDIPIEDVFTSFEDTDAPVVIRPYIEVVEDEEIVEEDIPFVRVEQKPLFNGGDANEFTRWVNSRLVYPEIAKENGSQGRVTLSFRVGKDGSVSDVKVLRSSSDPSLDQEAIRVVSSSPKWTPGRQRDRAVNVTYTFPVIFKLN